MKKRTSIALVISFMPAVTLLVATPKVASATSAYDDVIQTTSSLKLKPSDCTNESDITSTWDVDVRAAIKERTDANLYDTAFLTAWDYRKYTAVLQSYNTNGSKYLTIYYSDDTNGYGGFDSTTSGSYVYISSSTPATIRSITLVAWADSTGAGCSTAPRLTSATTSTILSLYSWQFGTSTGQNQFYMSSFPMTYPSGYEGLYIPTLPATTLYSGTIDCGGDDPASYVYIIQSGNSGAAVVTADPLIPGLANWSYNLTSANYAIQAGCGEHISQSETSVDPGATSGSWVCNPAKPWYCVLS